MVPISIKPSAVRAEVLFNFLTLPAVSCLFYVRLIPIYLHDKRAILFFGVTWIAIVAYFIYDSFRILSRYASTGIMAPGPIDSWGYILSLLYDTMVYFAISWQLAAFSIKGDSWRDRARSFVAGEGLPGLTRALLRSGQVYYL